MLLELAGWGLANTIFAAVATLLIAWSLYQGAHPIIGFVMHGISMLLGIVVIASLWSLPLAPVSAVWLIPLSVVIVLVILIPLDDALTAPDEELHDTSEAVSPSHTI